MFSKSGKDCGGYARRLRRLCVGRYGYKSSFGAKKYPVFTKLPVLEFESNLRIPGYPGILQGPGGGGRGGLGYYGAVEREKLPLLTDKELSFL